MARFEYCKPVLAKKVPTGPDWIHEVKYDGYRIRGRLEPQLCAKSCPPREVAF